MTDLLPYRTLLVLVDDTPLGRATAEEGVRLAHALGAKVLFHAAIPPTPPIIGEANMTILPPPVDYDALDRERAEKALAMARRLAADAGTPCDTLVSVGTDIAEAANLAANQYDCAMIVVGSYGRGTIARIILGSVMANLTQIADRPVLVCKLHEDSGAAGPGA
ncbi:MAG: universal stress protein [Betaproteobacteria bacterium]